MATYPLASHAQILEAHPHKRHRLRHWLLAIFGVILGMFILLIVAALLAPSPVQCSPPACAVPPPRVGPIPRPHRFLSSQFGYSLHYSTANITPSSTTASSIAWDATLGDGSTVAWSFGGTLAANRDAQQIVQDVQSNHFADANLAYTIPDAALGYTPGYGNIYDLTESPGNGQVLHERLVIMAAVKHGVAVVFTGVGPYRQTSAKNDGHPNPADTPLVGLDDVEQSVMSVIWKGDSEF
jgi:hypothetical protein